MEFNEFEEKMDKTISVFEENLSEIRAGRANPAILNKITINYYGTPTPINQVAGISVPEARLIVIQPWDASILKEIEKEILKADIGINPNNDGKVIRLVFPELNEERRKEIVKDIRKLAEEAKISIRAIRRDGIDLAKVKQKNSEITEDELKNAENQIQKLTDKKIEEIDKILENKEKELIEKYNTTDREYGYNIEKGGCLNKEVSQETREKIRQNMLGKKHSDKTKQRMSEARKGNKCYWYGKHLTEEHKQKLRETNKKTKKVNQYSTDGKYIKTFNSFREVAEMFNVTRQNIYAVCSGRRKTACGFIWRYADEESR